MSDILDRARALRRNGTEAETKLWRILRNGHMGVKFRRQVPIGPYIVDFICHELKLVIEADGGQHSENAKDEERTAFLNKEGFEVLRFWNNEITGNIDGVAIAVKNRIESMAAKENGAI